jgi:signal transduction histidine kinase
MRLDPLRRIGLRGRLILLFFFGLLPIAATEIVSLVWQRTALRDEAERDVIRLARLLGAHVEGTLRSTHQFLRLLDDHPAVRAGGAACETVLDQVVAASCAYSGVAVVDAGGQFVCTSPRPPKAGPPRRRTLHALFEKHDFTVTEAVVGPLSGKVIVVAGQAIRHDSRFAGAVMAGLDLANLSSLASRIELPREASFFIVGSEGTVLASYPEPGAWVGRSATAVPVHRNLLANPTGARAVETRGLDGAARLFGYAPIEAGGAKFFVVVGLDLAAVSAPADRIVRVKLAAVACALLFSLATAALAGESFLRRPIRKMLQTANRIAAGDVAARVRLEHAPGELGELARGIDQMAAGIQAREERLAALSRRILDVQESERRALAYELHDEIGQSLTALKLMVQGLRAQSASGQQEKLAETIQILDRTLQQARSLSLDLRPPMLDHLGLPATLRWYVEREAERAGFSAVCRIQPPDLRLDARLETTLFRIAQEALTNVTRHAGATAVAVSLMESGGEVELTIRDDGGGFDVNAARARALAGASFGICGMEERATLAGGRLTIRAGVFGTEVQSVFPLQKPAVDA